MFPILREYNFNILISSILKYNPGETNNKFITSVISYGRVQKESDELLYVRFGRSLWSAIGLPAQVVKWKPGKTNKFINS